MIENEAPQPNGRDIFSQASSGAESLRSENSSLTRGLTPRVFAKGDKTLIYRDFADSLRIEGSMAPPRKDDIVKGAVLYIKKTIEGKYNQYFGPNTIKGAEGLEDRVVILFPKGLTEYLKIMGSDLEEEDLKKVGAVRASIPLGNLIVSRSRKELAKMPDLKTVIDAYVKAGMARRRVRSDITAAALEYNLIHEVLHGYEAPLLPIYFEECAIHYYTSQIETEFGGFNLYPGELDEKVIFYTKLVKSFGDGINGMFFGGNQSKKLKNAVLKSFTPEVLKKIFPESYGATKKERIEFGKFPA